MELTEARQINNLHILEAGKKMPPDYLQALKLGKEAIKRILTMRSFNINQALLPLPGENPIANSTRSLHSIKTILESPLGREPKG